MDAGDWSARESARTIRALGALSYRSGEVRGYLREVVVALAELLGAHWVAVTLCADGVERVMASNLDPDPDSGELDAHGTVTDTVARTGKIVVVQDVAHDTSQGAVPDGYRAYLGVPLRTSRGAVLGTLCTFAREPRAFDADDIHLARIFAERAATSIDNFQLYEEQKRLATIGELVATIVHEIRNPLASIMLGLGCLEQKRLPDDARMCLEVASSEAARLERMLRELLLYSKPQVIARARLDVADVCREAVGTLERTPVAAARRIELVTPPGAALIDGDRDKLWQVVTNLVRNACEAVGAGDTVRCIVESRETFIELRVENGGAPIPPELIARVTEPFFTTKRNGTGLGLPLVKRVVEAHGGSLQIASDATHGTRITITLPRRNSTPPSA